jgi:hypothetical protein
MYVPTAVDRYCWQMSVDPPGSEEISNMIDVKSGEVWGGFVNEMPPLCAEFVPSESAKCRL